MESECVDWPDVVDIVDRLPVAFECILFVLGFLTRIKVLDANPTFD